MVIENKTYFSNVKSFENPPYILSNVNGGKKIQTECFLKYEPIEAWVKSYVDVFHVTSQLTSSKVSTSLNQNNYVEKPKMLNRGVNLLLQKLNMYGNNAAVLSAVFCNFIRALLASNKNIKDVELI